MPSLPGFSDNPLITRDDIVNAVDALITPLTKYQSPFGARIRLPVATGTHFDETAAQLEGFARPLWAIAPLLSSTNSLHPSLREKLNGWINGLAAGTDPDSRLDEYWGEVGDKDQRMVEIEILGFALLIAPTAFLGDPNSVDPEVVKRRENIKRYLNSVNGKQFPPTNWLWFRVIANLALIKSCGVGYETLKDSMNADLQLLDTFHIGDGWAADGSWGDGGKQMDYYSGSFAIQFSQLMYARFAGDIDKERCEVFRQRARAFAVDFWRYFNTDGSAIPFGRSLTYRFAMGAFWAAVALSDTELPAPLTLGTIKGLLLRHLRWWAKQENIFYADGSFNIGYCYPNMYLSEDYNSPQSPYWCMKAFCALGLPADHPFWSAEEEDHPLLQTSNSGSLSKKLLEHPQQILINSRTHHFLLSSGQFCAWPLKATEAKYSKFAYSSAFGFSIPTGPLIQQTAPDSTLTISLDKGESWRTRWKSEGTRVGEVQYFGSNARNGQERKLEKLPSLINRWMPSKASNVAIETTLIPPTDRWPDWHIRVHKITTKSLLTDSLDLVEGGFAIYGRRQHDGGNLPIAKDFVQSEESPHECQVESATSSLIISNAGASGIKQLSRAFGRERGIILKPDANTNLMVSRTLIPTIQQQIRNEKNTSETIITAVFAISGSSLSPRDIRKRWIDEPVVMIGETPTETAFIHLEG